MKHKKVMLVACLLLAILTIGSVSAIEDTTISDDAVELSQDVDDALTVEDSQEEALENQVEESIASDDADDALSYDASDLNVEGLSVGDISIYVSDTVSADYDYIAWVGDDDYLDGKVIVTIDNKTYYNKEFNRADAIWDVEIRAGDLDGINVFAEDFLGNHTVKLTYGGLTEEKYVPFIFEPYFIQPNSAAIGEVSYIVFNAPGNFKGSVTLYNAVYNDTTHEYEAGTKILTHSISASSSEVPLPVLTKEDDYYFIVKYTIDGKNYTEIFDVYVFKNSPDVSSNISESEINIGESLTITVTGHNAGDIGFCLDGEYIGADSFDNSTAVKRTFSGLTEGTHLIEVYGVTLEYEKYFVVKVKKNIANANVKLSKTAFTYNAKVQKPTVTLTNGAVLKEGVDYTLKWSASPKNVGTYTVIVTGIGAYKGTTKATFKINKAANPLKVKAKTAKVKLSKLEKKAQKLKVTKVVKFTKKGQGTLTYKKVKGNKKITINKKTGKVTVAKGLKKGTYKVKVKIKAKGNANYKASTFKTVTFKIVIK
ncbi:hypothetical protein [Methanobrevibacter sp.]|uniref:hypothetical protein n=1 Tax=Methanobrevibacter sp. TaxID=66852 RepID=UPI0038703612